MDRSVSFIKIGKVAVILQIITLIMGILINIIWGAVPTSVQEYFLMFEENWVLGMIRDESYNIVIIFLYLFSTTAVLFSLKDNLKPMLIYGILFVLISVILVLTIHTGFSMMYLGDQFHLANTPELKRELLIAGSSIVSQNMWHSSGGFFAGLLMQGGWFMISLAMIESKIFSKLTIISGLLCNGLDLINHLLHYSYPDIANIFLYVAGPFYILWYIYLIKDFSRIVKNITRRVP